MRNNDPTGDGKVEMNEYVNSITEALLELANELEIEWINFLNFNIYLLFNSFIKIYLLYDFIIILIFFIQLILSDFCFINSGWQNIL